MSIIFSVCVLAKFEFFYRLKNLPTTGEFFIGNFTKKRQG